jgi:hypothetical protein
LLHDPGLELVAEQAPTPSVRALHARALPHRDVSTTVHVDTCSACYPTEVNGVVR